VGVLSRLLNHVSEVTAKIDILSESGLKSWVEELAALHALQIQAQALIGMFIRVAAELGYSPETPLEAGRALLGENMLSHEEYELFRRVAGFRNILVHTYTSVDMGLVHRIIDGKEYRRVALIAANLLERAVERGIDP